MSAAEPSGRSSGRVANGGASDLRRAATGGRSSNDSLAVPAAPRRVGATQAEQVIAGLTPLERAIVLTLARVRLATGGQLQRLHFASTLSGQRQARRTLLSLTERRVLTRLGRTIGGRRAGSAGFVYGLDVIGQRLVRPDDQWRRPWTPGQAFVAHAIEVTECYVTLVEGARQGRWGLLDFQAEPACWRSFVGRHGRHLVLKPDAFLRAALGEFEDRWFVEVDRGTEDLGRIRRKALIYLDYWRSGREAVFPRVLWATTRPARRDALASGLAALPAETRGLFQVCVSTQFSQVVAAGAGDQCLDQHVNEGGDHDNNNQ